MPDQSADQCGYRLQAYAEVAANDKIQQRCPPDVRNFIRALMRPRPGAEPWAPPETAASAAPSRGRVTCTVGLPGGRHRRRTRLRTVIITNAPVTTCAWALSGGLPRMREIPGAPEGRREAVMPTIAPARPERRRHAERPCARLPRRLCCRQQEPLHRPPANAADAALHRANSTRHRRTGDAARGVRPYSGPDSS